MAAGDRDEGLITFDSVTYRYPGMALPALDNIRLEISRGEFVGLIGATGAGKSTFCQALNGIVPQFFGGEFSGSIRIGGDDTIDVPTSRLAARIGMVFEDPETQITATTVEAETAFALENLNVPTAEIRRRVDLALASVGLSGQELKHPANLSGGQKQRLAIAAALALAPDIIVLDEPTSQLDPIAARDVFAILLRLNREEGLTLVVASHASEELAEAADRILLMDAGSVVEEGPPDRLFADIARLKHCFVRPPEIAQTFGVLARLSPQAVPEQPPVTLDAAIAAIGPLNLRPKSSGRGPDSPVVRDAGTAALSVHALKHTYPDGTVSLRGIDLDIRQGSFTGIVGQNGSGKSTLVRHFLKLLDAPAGAVKVQGDDVAAFKVSDLARRIGYVAQNAHQQIFCDRVDKEVGFALTMQKRDKAEVHAAVERSLAAMELGWAADRHPISLSRGDSLRVAIAAVLALDPEILIFDEPTTGQDWRGALAIMEILRSLNRSGKTILLITHHLYLLPGFVERLIVMNGGTVVLDGPLRDVLYAGEQLELAGLAPPQTVRFAGKVAGLRPLRPLGPDDLADLVADGSGQAA